MKHFTKMSFAKWMHDTYEKIAKEEGWTTQERSRVSWKKLPLESKAVMVRMSEEILRRIKKEGVVGYDDFRKYICIPLRVFNI